MTRYEEASFSLENQEKKALRFALRAPHYYYIYRYNSIWDDVITSQTSDERTTEQITCCRKQSSRLLQLASSVFSPTSQPFSASNCRREYYLLENLPEYICSLCSASIARHSTAEHSAVNPQKQQSKFAQIRARQRTQGNRIGSSQHVVEAFVQLAVFSKRTKKSQCARPTKKSTTIHKAA